MLDFFAAPKLPAADDLKHDRLTDEKSACGRARPTPRSRLRGNRSTIFYNILAFSLVYCYSNAPMQVNDLQFTVHPSSGVPIYRQIMDQVVASIGSGRAKPGDELPSTRKLAEVLEVNMMTVSKAYARLESEGVLTRIRGRGMIVAKDNGVAASSVKQRQQELRPLIEQAVHRGFQLKLTERQIKTIVESVIRETKK